MNRLRWLSLALVLLFSAGTAFSVRLSMGNQATAKLKITVGTFSPAKGKLMVAVYNQPDAFPTNSNAAVKRMVVPVTGATTEVTVTGLLPGTYAVSVVHDANGNNRMDTNRLGIPKEAYGTSNDAKGTFGPPKWEDARFEVKDGEQAINITLNQ